MKSFTARRLVVAAMVSAAAALWGVVFHQSRNRTATCKGFVFKGGQKGEPTWSETPLFEVQEDWTIEVDLKGNFQRAILVVGPPENDGWELELIDPEKPADRIVKSFRTGGDYAVVLLGDGTWQAAIKQDEP
jgi:hypothetical protein